MMQAYLGFPGRGLRNVSLRLGRCKRVEFQFLREVLPGAADCSWRLTGKLPSSLSRSAVSVVFPELTSGLPVGCDVLKVLNGEPVLCGSLRIFISP